MATTKLISVFGATGSQGGAVSSSLLLSGNYKVRALTRNPESDASKKLIEMGAEVVKCDYSDSKEEIKKALKGSDGVFLVTSMGGKIKESEVGIKIADAAFDEGVKNFVFSGLSACNIISNGRYNVPHFDQKFEIEEHTRSLSKSNPTFVSSFVYAPFYYQNFKTFFQPKKQESDDGTSFSINLPSDPSGKPLDMGDINDIGPIVLGIFNDKTKYSGVTVPFSGSTLSGNQIADAFTKQTGKQVTYNYIPPTVFSKFPFPGANEIAEMFSFYNEFGAFNVLDKSIAPKINKLTTFEEWLKNVNFKLE